MYVFAVLCLISSIAALPAPQDAIENVEVSTYSSEANDIVQNLPSEEEKREPISEDKDNESEINDDGEKVEVKYDPGHGADNDEHEKNQEDEKKKTEVKEEVDEKKEPVPVLVKFEDATTRLPIFSIISWIYCHWPSFPFARDYEFNDDTQEAFTVKVLLNSRKEFKSV